MPVLPLKASDYRFPPVELAEEDGLLAFGGDLSPERLLNAYCSGVFPWFGDRGPILWWSPDPRTFVTPDQLHIPIRLERTIRSGKFEIRENTDFRAVITHCACVPRAKQKGTWIVPEMIEAYCEMHRLGLGYSIEAWRNGTLVGGVYGVQLGKVFFAESMFSLERDASKVALVHLLRSRFEAGFLFVDAQVYNDHLGQFGFLERPRSEFLRLLRQAIA
jgi:leucyl/phenylalanyl-tRNA--protein transferase